MEFEVFIPSGESDGFDVTLRIEAENWMQALKLGLSRTGSSPDVVRNVLCDIKDKQVIHVTDLVSHRVFKIRQHHRQGSGITGRPNSGGRFRHPREFPAVRPDNFQKFPTMAAKVAKAAAQAEKAGLAHDEEPGKAEASARPPRGVMAESGVYRRIGSHEISASHSENGDRARILQEQRSPTTPRLAVVAVAPEGNGAVADSTLELVFLEMGSLFQDERPVEAAVALTLDLAVKYIPAESGSILFTDESGERLHFAAARGPKAQELLARDFVVPIGQGIAGFTVREGVNVAITDAPKDQRYYRDIAQALGYPAKSLLCAPIQWEGQCYGALELVNHKTRESFSAAEMTVASYIAGHLARYLHQKFS